MTEETTPRIPTELQPRPRDVGYDLAAALDAVVSLRARVPEDAFTASVLGTERAGHGVLINDSGLIATIGYLVTEADDIWIVTNRGQAVPGHLVGYDYESGFGLVQALGRLDCAPLELGDPRAPEVGDDLVLAGHGGAAQSIKVQLAARRAFAGYWEYVLDEALLTAPPHPNWGGAALLGADGRLLGIGSLYIDQITPVIPDLDGNLSVPVDLLTPIMDDLLRYGRTMKPARPWLGMFVTETEDGFVVAGMYNDAPADDAGLAAGDLVREVGGVQPGDLVEFFRSMWSIGEAGCRVPLLVEREGKLLDIDVASVDRRDFWKRPELH
ncbi:MAG: serine protease [Gammaproteobacteria bacterium]|nr:serine protease [Gammaproteobacteria bacterium]